MYATLIYIRLKQLSRQGKSSVFMYVLLGLIALFVCAATVVYFNKSGSLAKASGLCLGLILMVTSVHFSREDRSFVYHHIYHPKVNLLTEYLFFTSPVLVGLLFTSYWWFVIPIISFLGVISVITYQTANRTGFLFISKLIPASNFEWIGGLRKQLVILAILYVLALAFIWVRILPLVLLWLVTTLIMSFYNHAEGIDLLRANHDNAKKLLRKKFTHHALLLVVLYFPIALGNAFFNQGFVLINGLFLILQVFMLCFAIAFKYANYQPNQYNQGNIITSLVAFGGIVPFMIPLPAIMAVSYYFKAIENLQTYFNDQHQQPSC